jgi:uncharacterized protein
MKVSLDRLNKERRIEIDEDDPQFAGSPGRESTIGPLRVRLLLRAAAGAVQVTGTLNGVFTGVCDRCMEPFTRERHITVDEVFELDEVEARSREINVSSHVRDIVMEQVPVRQLCSDGCRGICTGCSANLNREQCRCT